ncbi:MAG: RluA family pseudouridine synthase [Pirellulaceae bacterium]
MRRPAFHLDNPDRLKHMSSPESLQLLVSHHEAGIRLDAFLARHCPTHSRVQLRRAITAGGVSVDGKRPKPAYRLEAGEQVVLVVPELPRTIPEAEPIPLDILHEDDDLVAINKQPGMVVHPSKGHGGGTLVNALAHRFSTLSAVGGACRPGIVHRLDRDTSGVIVVAKSDAAHMALAAQWERRVIEKEYVAIVVGEPDRDRDRIEQPIGIHPCQREKMAIRPRHRTTRQAFTFYEVSERFGRFALLRVVPKTGRTHQIRVHLAHIGCPVLCDRLYGGRASLTRGDLQRTGDSTVLLDRQALHARRLCFTHPTTSTPMDIEAPIPGDMQRVLDELRRLPDTGT